MKKVLKRMLGPSVWARLKTARHRPDLLLPLRARKSSYGFLLSGNASDQTYQLALSSSYGDYISNFIRDLPSNAAFLDIGANVGIFSLIASKHLSAGRVLSFEPNVDVFTYLVKNLQQNGCTNVTPLNMALTDGKARLVNLHLQAYHSGRNSLEFGGDRTVSVLAVPGGIVGDLIEPSSKIAVKLDVEGHELSVLRGLAASPVLSRVHWMVIEVSEPTIGAEGARNLHEFLTQSGFVRASRSSAALHRDEIYIRP